MANWSLPTLTDLYANFRQYISDRLDDAAKMFDSATTTPTNQPAGTKRWNSTSNKFEKWSGSAWSDLASTYGISISGNAATATTAGSVTTVTSASITSGLGYTPANIASPTFTGLPKAPTAAPGTNTTQLATTAFVAAALGGQNAPVASPVFTGNLYTDGAIVSTGGVLRTQGYGGDVTKGLIYFGNDESAIVKDGNKYAFHIPSILTAYITKSGTVAMTSDIPAAGIPYVVGSDSVGATIMAKLQAGGSAVIDQDVSGSLLNPCSANGVTAGAARSGTWRCRGNAPITNSVTDWLKIA